MRRILSSLFFGLLISVFTIPAAHVFAQPNLDSLLMERLEIVAIREIPFTFNFRNNTNITVGTNIGGFVVADITSSNLTLKRGDKLLCIPKKKTVPWQEYEAKLVDKNTGNTLMLRIESEFQIDDRKFMVKNIHGTEHHYALTLMDINSGQLITLKRVLERPDK